jgi:hypothetical protein
MSNLGLALQLIVVLIYKVGLEIGHATVGLATG